MEGDRAKGSGRRGEQRKRGKGKRRQRRPGRKGGRAENPRKPHKTEKMSFAPALALPLALAFAAPFPPTGVLGRARSAALLSRVSATADLRAGFPSIFIFPDVFTPDFVLLPPEHSGSTIHIRAMYSQVTGV